MSGKDLKILLDYITNLQQATKDTKDTADDMLYELKQENEELKKEKDDLYLDNTMLKMEKDIYKQGYEDLKNLLNILQNGSENDE